MPHFYGGITDRNANDNEANDIWDGEGIRSPRHSHTQGRFFGAHGKVGAVGHDVWSDRTALPQSRKVNVQQRHLIKTGVTLTMRLQLQEPEVSVIVPTMAALSRAHSLSRAIESVRRSSTQPVKIIVVVNGRRYDARLMKWLGAQPDIDLHYQEMPSSPEAIKVGRSLVTTKYFSTLDDDDEYLDGAIDIRLPELEKSPLAAVIVTNGYRRFDGRDASCYKNLSNVSDNPLLALMEIPWLNSANALYRSAAVDIDYFENSHPYAEWTWLAFNLAMHNKQFVTIDTPTFRINDTTGSLSKSQAYEQGYESLFKRMLARQPPAQITKLIKQKLGSVYHQYADTLLKEGNRISSLKWHVRSLTQPGGFRYISFTRRLFLPSK